MSRNPVQIRATWGQGKTLSTLSDVIAKRQKYLNETAFQSIHAIAVDTLKSIRGVTKIAKPSGIKVSVEHLTQYRFSYTSLTKTDGEKARFRKMCLRTAAGVRIDPSSTSTKIVFADLHGVKTKSVHVYGFVDAYETAHGYAEQKYAICAVSQAIAKRVAKQIVARRLMRYAGLARRAISVLMIKTNTRGPSDTVSSAANAKAFEVTTSRNVVATDGKGNGKYALILEDALHYAVRAVKGGTPAVNLAFQKAANKSIGLIRHKCKDLLAPGELKTPFPEITRRRK